jgi:acylphosphatase
MTREDTEPIRRTAYFSGRVQGVGFRYITESVAAGFDVTGTVRNLRDGRVELIAEGVAAELGRFIAAVHEALAGYIQSVEVADSAGTGEFERFRISHSAE